jgi:hypothetical protein
MSVCACVKIECNNRDCAHEPSALLALDSNSLPKSLSLHAIQSYSTSPTCRPTSLEEEDVVDGEEDVEEEEEDVEKLDSESLSLVSESSRPARPGVVGTGLGPRLSPVTKAASVTSGLNRTLDQPQMGTNGASAHSNRYSRLNPAQKHDPTHGHQLTSRWLEEHLPLLLPARHRHLHWTPFHLLQ